MYKTIVSWAHTHIYIYICVCVWLGCIMWIWVHHRGTHNHEESPLRDHVVVWQIIPLVKVYAVYAITNHTCGIKFHIPGGKGVNNHMLPPHSPHIYILHIYIYNYCYLSIYSPYIYMCVYIYVCVGVLYIVCVWYICICVHIMHMGYTPQSSKQVKTCEHTNQYTGVTPSWKFHPLASSWQVYDFR